jgi:type IV secretory pathway VirD2 relaxase
MFGATEDRTDAMAFARRGLNDRHHFRFIVTPEDADAHPLSQTFRSSIPAIDLRRLKPLKKVLRAGSRRSWLRQ